MFFCAKRRKKDQRVIKAGTAAGTRPLSAVWREEFRMKISELDRNFAVETELKLPDAVWLNAKDPPFVLYGLMPAKTGEPFYRMPKDVAEATKNDSVKGLNGNTSGGRVRFRTDSPYIAIRAVMPDNLSFAHITKLGKSGFDLEQVDGDKAVYIASFIPNPEKKEHGFASSRPTDGQMHTYTINMPLYDDVEELWIGLSREAQLEAPEPYRFEKPILYYGSSITQGGCASRPGNAYPAMISRKYNVNFVNLGFSGGCKGEPVMAEYLASLDPLIFVLDYDHNAPTTEHLQKTHYPVYATFRRAHPTTPIILISKPNYIPVTTAQRREVILETYRRGVEAGDRNLYFIDGMTLFDGEMRDSCTVDGLHPNDLGFFRMANVIGDVIGKILSEMN